MPSSVAVLGNFPNLSRRYRVGAVAVVEQYSLIKLQGTLGPKDSKTEQQKQKMESLQGQIHKIGKQVFKGEGTNKDLWGARK